MAQNKLFTKSQPVVSAGLKWSIDSAEKHSSKNSFIRVGEKPSTRFLSGAPRSWSSVDPAENRTVFNLTFRISGTPENITSALQSCQPPYDPQAIADCLADCITKDNYETTKKDEYDEEVAIYKKMIQDKVPVDHYSVDQIKWFAKPEVIKGVKVESKKSAAAGKNGSEASRTRLSPGSSIKERMDKINVGFILDISQMTSDFKNIKTKPIPKTNKSGKVYSGDLPFLTNDYEKYYQIVNHVYGTEGLLEFQDNLEDIKNQLTNGKNNQKQLKSNIPQATSTPSTVSTKPKPNLIPSGNPTVKSPKVNVINPSPLNDLPSMK